MAVAHDASTQTAAFATASTQTTTHTPVGTPKGVLVRIVQDGSTADQVSRVEYADVPITRVARITNASPAGAVYVYWLSGDLPTGAQSVDITSIGTAAKRAVVTTVTADTSMTRLAAAPTTSSGTTANPRLSVVTPADVQTKSYLALHHGVNTPVTSVTGEQSAHEFSHDFGDQSAMWSRGGDSGGTVNLGYNAVADGWAGVMVAIRELEPVGSTYALSFDRVDDMAVIDQAGAGLGGEPETFIALSRRDPGGTGAQAVIGVGDAVTTTHGRFLQNWSSDDTVTYSQAGAGQALVNVIVAYPDDWTLQGVRRDTAGGQRLSIWRARASFFTHGSPANLAPAAADTGKLLIGTGRESGGLFFGGDVVIGIWLKRYATDEEIESLVDPDLNAVTLSRVLALEQDPGDRAYALDTSDGTIRRLFGNGATTVTKTGTSVHTETDAIPWLPVEIAHGGAATSGAGSATAAGHKTAHDDAATTGAGTVSATGHGVSGNVVHGSAATTGGPSATGGGSEQLYPSGDLYPGEDLYPGPTAATGSAETATGHKIAHADAVTSGSGTTAATGHNIVDAPLTIRLPTSMVWRVPSSAMQFRSGQQSIAWRTLGGDMEYRTSEGAMGWR